MCRYLVMRIGSCPEDMEIDSVSLVERRVDVTARGRFTTVGEDWERLWGTGEQTLAASRQEVYALGDQQLNWDQLYVWATNDLYVTGSVDTARTVLAGSETPIGGEQACFYALFVELAQRYRRRAIDCRAASKPSEQLANGRSRGCVGDCCCRSAGRGLAGGRRLVPTHGRPSTSGPMRARSSPGAQGIASCLERRARAFCRCRRGQRLQPLDECLGALLRFGQP